MKKIIISLAALAAVSTAALAERNYDISSPPVGEAVFKSKNTHSTYPLSVVTGGSSIVDDSLGNGTVSGSNSGSR
jgi:hypothetical protein